MGEASQYTENFKLVFFLFAWRQRRIWKLREDLAAALDLCNTLIISIIHLNLGLALEYIVFTNA